MQKMIFRSLVRVWIVLIIVLLQGCYPISDPDLWPRDFVQKDTLPTLVGKHEEKVLEKLGFPTYVVKRGDTFSYLYQDYDVDRRMWMLLYIPIITAWEKGIEASCVLLNFGGDGVLQQYEIRVGGAATSDSNCTDLFGLDDSEFLDPRLHVSIGGDYGIEEQYQWYTVRPPNDPTRIPYLCRAADGGHPNAQIEVGRHFAQGVDGVPQDLRRAYVWYSLAKGGFSDVVQLQLIMKKMTLEQIEEAEQMLGACRT